MVVAVDHRVKHELGTLDGVGAGAAEDEVVGEDVMRAAAHSLSSVYRRGWPALKDPALWLFNLLLS